MTPLQSFNIIDRLTKSIAIMDEKGRSNEGCSSYLLWNDEWKYMRQQLWLALETAKSIEIDV